MIGVASRLDPVAEVTLDELRIELTYPLDDIADRFFREALAADTAVHPGTSVHSGHSTARREGAGLACGSVLSRGNEAARLCHRLRRGHDPGAACPACGRRV